MRRKAFQRLTTHPREIFFHIKSNQLIILYIQNIDKSESVLSAHV